MHPSLITHHSSRMTHHSLSPPPPPPPPPSFTHPTKVTNSSIVVLQMSAWFQASPNISFAESSLSAAFDAIRIRVGHVHWARRLVVFSSSAPFDKCHSIEGSGPTRSPGGFKKGETHRHGWQRIPEYNALAERMVRRVGGTYLDITTMLAYRPDGHMSLANDCQHWCLPGPYDIGERRLHARRSPSTRYESLTLVFPLVFPGVDASVTPNHP